VTGLRKQEAIPVFHHYMDVLQYKSQKVIICQSSLSSRSRWMGTTTKRTSFSRPTSSERNSWALQGPDFACKRLSVCRPSVVPPVAISRKLSKIEPLLVWTIKGLWFSDCVVSFRSSTDACVGRHSGFKWKLHANIINTAYSLTWHRTTNWNWTHCGLQWRL